MKKNLTAVITGASRGIGKAIAKYLSSKNYTLLLIARDQKNLDQLKNELGSQHTVIAADVRDFSNIEKVIHAFVTEHGSLTLLFISAGYVKRGSSELLREEFSKMLDVNLIGTFNTINASVPYMKRQQYGRIVVMSSYSGKVARAALGGYAASKFGVMGLCESLYKELAPYNINVTALCPNLVNTDMTSDVDMPREKMISTDDIVKTLDYLLSLSESVSIKEVVLQCKDRIIKNELY